MNYIGSFDELKNKLDPLFPKRQWKEVSANLKQCKGANGTILNWCPSTGTITFQGSKPGKKLFEQINSVLEVKPEIPQTRVDIPEKSKTPDTKDDNCLSSEYVDGKYADSELIISLVGAVGTNLKMISDIIKERLHAYRYEVETISVSNDVIGKISSPAKKFDSEYERIKKFIELGDQVREDASDNSILASGTASVIMSKRQNEQKKPMPKKRTAYIINSLKHPEEVEKLREIYTCGFFLIGVYSDIDSRKKYLVEDKMMTKDQAEHLIQIDEDEDIGHGQHTRDTFQMADFFIHLHDKNILRVKKSIWRILDLIFGNSFITPTFDEFAMFMAFASALRSADLSRQVGAVIAKDNEIIASGANDCPKAGGGLYWPEFNKDEEIVDYEDGRDYKRGFDSNKIEQAKIVNDIIQHLGMSPEYFKDKIIKSKLIESPEIVDEIIRHLEISPENFIDRILKSKIKDITEYGRVVHAEMEALLMCARNNFSTRSATIYCTTFPCHNCAKHIIAAGIDRVVYVEPYPKSKAFEFYKDSVSQDPNEEKQLVKFIPFIGVGPRKFFELFSMSLGFGYNMIRKDKSGCVKKWEVKNGRIRTQLLPCSYLDKEEFATKLFNTIRRD